MVNVQVSQIASVLRRAAPAALLAAALCVGAAAVLRATEPAAFFRIGTGGPAGTTFPIGEAIAEALRPAFAADACADPPCPSEALLPVAQLSNGSLANLRDLAAGRLEAALVRADVTHWAARGGGPLAGQAAMTELRAVANLYPETLHVVTLRRGGFRSIADLRGRRLSLDAHGSGTPPLARRVLAAYGIGGRDFEAHYIRPGLAIEQLAAGKLDAFFAVGGAPLRSVQRLAEIAELQILPVDAERLGLDGDDWSFAVPAVLAAGTYEGVAETPTLATAALLLVRAELPSAVAGRMTARLWHAETRARLAEVHPQGGRLRAELAVRGLPVPLHPGAAGYYRELGLLP
jgi:TRAP transporter TAXI family solute receptor